MKTQEFKIEVPRGFEIDTAKSTFEKIVFKEVGSRMDKVYAFHKTTEKAFNKLYEELPLRSKYMEIEAMIVAYKNNGWVPKKYDRSYYPYFNFYPFGFSGSDYYEAYAVVPLALCFKNETLLKEAVEEFKEEYKLSRMTI